MGKEPKPAKSTPASKAIPLRLRPIVVAYIDDLDHIGGFGKGRAGVIRRFVENGIAQEIARNVLQKRDSREIPEEADESEED